jgi:hypothetical protein
VCDKETSWTRRLTLGCSARDDDNDDDDDDDDNNNNNNKLRRF